ncbi:MAG: 30S ribosomal protein S10 [Candidatus Heimdallarchaeota archaeon]|nr:30S ribosomal protein S10 [Candidatus Heimdallarchaeota archaeon]
MISIDNLVTFTLVAVARIRLMSADVRQLDGICDEMRRIADKSGVKMRGPIPLPTKKLNLPVRKSPSGQGTATWEDYELRIHKRLIDIDADDRTMRQIIRLNVSRSLFVEIELRT